MTTEEMISPPPQAPQTCARPGWSQLQRRRTTERSLERGDLRMQGVDRAPVGSCDLMSRPHPTWSSSPRPRNLSGDSDPPYMPIKRDSSWSLCESRMALEAELHIYNIGISTWCGAEAACTRSFVVDRLPDRKIS
ncbi:hypothetical protein M758_4G233800 [Ceratodon purpureus]|nr:hypothetical protein M758_4G233800 [Ceratodon purpureus]